MVTIHDVAARANVSIATVSRVFTGRNEVSEGKRRAVLKASEDLDYHPDGLAAALRSRTTSSVGVLVPDITNPFFAAIVQSTVHELAGSGIDVVFSDSANDPRTEKERLRTLLGRRVDALLVCPVHARDSVPALRSAAKATRVIQLDRLAIADMDFVGVDHSAGMGPLVDHLVSRGARTARFVGVTDGIPPIADRARGLVEAGARSGLDVGAIVEIGFPDLAHGREYARDSITRGTLPDVVVCANDELAAGVLLEMGLAGLSSPGDHMVTGYDDVPFAEILGLTSVRQPLRQLGREAARLLAEDGDAPRHVLLRPTVVARRTTGARS